MEPVVELDAKDKEIEALRKCSKCNRGLGMFDHSPDLLKKAREYVQTVGKPA